MAPGAKSTRARIASRQAGLTFTTYGPVELLCHATVLKSASRQKR
jgi:hypothetical protein